jgi:hypothetical protein
VQAWSRQAPTMHSPRTAAAAPSGGAVSLLAGVLSEELPVEDIVVPLQSSTAVARGRSVAPPPSQRPTERKMADDWGGDPSLPIWKTLMGECARSGREAFDLPAATGLALELKEKYELVVRTQDCWGGPLVAPEASMASIVADGQAEFKRTQIWKVLSVAVEGVDADEELMATLDGQTRHAQEVSVGERKEAVREEHDNVELSIRLPCAWRSRPRQVTPVGALKEEGVAPVEDAKLVKELTAPKEKSKVSLLLGPKRAKGSKVVPLP